MKAGNGSTIQRLILTRANRSRGSLRSASSALRCITVLKRLLAMVETVQQAIRSLRRMRRDCRRSAGATAIQMLSITIGAPQCHFDSVHPHLSAGFSISGWLAVLLTFLAWYCGRHARRPRRDGLTCPSSSIDDVPHDRRMTLTDLADRVGLTPANLSILDRQGARDPVFDARCDLRGARCQPGTYSDSPSTPNASRQRAKTQGRLIIHDVMSTHSSSLCPARRRRQ